MRVFISKNCNHIESESGDGYFVLNRDCFSDYVDQEDFHCRASLNIAHVYHKNWFEADNKFLPPILYFHNRKIKFINGRHRTALLFEFLPEIPVIFLSPNAYFGITDEEIKFNCKLLNKIAKPLKPDQYFEFPDLSIEKLG